jgi:general secretion pathway protein L
MADSFVLRFPLPGTTADEAEWLSVDGSGAPTGVRGHGTLAAAAAVAGGRRVLVIVPGEDVALSAPELPPRSGGRLAKLVPFALEEQLAADVDTLHFALGRQGADRRVPVAAIERSRLAGWLEQLAAAGLAPAALYPDTLVTPDNPAHVVVLLDGGRVIVRRPGALPLVLDAEPLAAALASAGLEPAPDAGASTAHVIVYATPSDWELHAPAIEALREAVASLRVQLLADGPLPLLAGGAAKAAWQLLQGEFAVRQGFGAEWPRWRPAALMLGAFLALHLLTLGLDYWRVHRDELKVEADLKAAAAEALPDVKNLARLPNVRAAVESRLHASRAVVSEGLLGTLGVLAVARGAAPDTRIDSLSYRDGMTELTVDAPDVGALDRLREAARGRGFGAELVSATQRDARYQGHIQLKGPGR